MRTSVKVLGLSIVLIIFSVIFGQLSIVFALDSSYLDDLELKSFGITSFEMVNPNLLVYPLKRLSEEIKLNLIFDKEQKKKYLYNLFQIRLKELVYIVNNKKEGFLFFTADRYNSFVGEIKRGHLLDSKTKFQAQIKLLERLRDIYPANSQYWVKLQQTIDVTKSLI